MKSSIQIEQSWYDVLEQEFEQPYFHAIKSFLLTEKTAGKTIYPQGQLIFNAFNTTPFQAVKVVILGQDPYHGAGEAMGLSFSVPQGVRTPPSLQNMYKELQTDIAGFTPPKHGDLTAWAHQGVLLLNAMLTVEANKAGSHKDIGWQKFTDAVIKTISDKRENVVFLLWGNFAKGKKVLIDTSKHLVLEAAHPSPLAKGAFFGSQPFSQTNVYLKEKGLGEIHWQH